MTKEQKRQIIELSQGKTTQKKIAAEVGATLIEVRSFLKEFKENPAAVVLELSKQEFIPPTEPEPRIPTMLETMQQHLQNSKSAPAIVMSPAVAALPPKRSSNSSKYESAIFRPRKK